MIKLYYTTKVATDEAQTRADLSLGGFKSSTLIPNNSLGSLFSDLSLYSIQRNSNEFIAIIATNVSEVDITNVNVWFEYPKMCQRRIEIAAVDLNADGEMESVESAFSQPYYSDFHEADGEVNKLSVGDIDAGTSIGIWLKSSIELQNVEGVYSDENIEMNGNPIEEDELIRIIFEWS